MAKISKNDLTLVYITANKISKQTAYNFQTRLLKAADDSPIITVSKMPTGFGDQEIICDTPSSHVNIYWEALMGVKAAKTKYVAICEDDVLYSPEHFKFRPEPGKFAYNISCWGIYTWNDPPIFSHRIYGGRRNHGMLICERDLYIEAMEERFAKYPDHSQIRIELWAEPGKYEKHLGVTPRETQEFNTNPPNIMFSHEKGLSYPGMTTRKRLGELRAYEIPYWGQAKIIRRLYV